MRRDQTGANRESREGWGRVRARIKEDGGANMEKIPFLVKFLIKFQ